MADLSYYRVVDFDQSFELDFITEDITAVKDGVCFALCVAWMQLDSYDDKNTLVKNFSTHIEIQKVYQESGLKYRDDLIKSINKIKHITGLYFEHKVSGNNVNPIKLHLASLEEGKDYMIGLEWQSDDMCHAIAVRRISKESIVLFDPNYGIYKADSAEDAADMADALFSKYLSEECLAVSTWHILSVSKA